MRLWFFGADGEVVATMVCATLPLPVICSADDPRNEYVGHINIPPGGRIEIEAAHGEAR